MNTILTPNQITFYQDEGYLHASNVIPTDLLNLMRTVLMRWEAQTIEGWLADGLIEDSCADLDFQVRLDRVWHAASKPKYMRSPRRDLVSREMFDILIHPALLNLAQDLLGTPDVSVHGIFNARPKLPDQLWTQTPWHQDAQYYRDAEKTPVISIWVPIQPVREENSCLQVAPKQHRGALHDGYDDPETGFLGLSPAVRDTLTGVSIEMEPGDALCFTQLTPHRALPNRSDQVRWSMDFRYEPTAQATEAGQKQGFVARSASDPNAVITYEDWLPQWVDIPLGNY
ncbi:MAG: phytanoyl-CoA dioxygenase family protein [Chloroflexota bacterium]